MTRILIDMQACQTESRLRGMGRYARELTRALIAAAQPGDEYHLLFNASLENSLSQSLREFKSLLPATQIHIVQLPKLTQLNDPGNAQKNCAAELLYEAFVGYIMPDVLFVPSFFEGFVDDATISFEHMLPCPVVVTIHDLIPLLYKGEYLSKNPGYKAAYTAKLHQIESAAALVAISDSSAAEAHEHLLFEQARITNASEAADPMFKPIDVGDAERDALYAKFDIRAPFVFYTGGADHRKNLYRLIEAFGAMPKDTRSNYDLVFAGSIPKQERLALQEAAKQHKIGSKLKLLGYVSDRELVDLFNLTALFVFPSLHEGFGLPPLEAMQCGTPTIAANCSSIPEVVGNSKALFEPNDTAQLSKMMAHVLQDETFRQDLASEGLARAKEFSWAKTADIVRSVLDQYAAPPALKDPSWTGIQQHFDQIDQQTAKSLVQMLAASKKDHGAFYNKMSQLMADNRRSVEQRLTYVHSTRNENGILRLEGPFDSSYSLALVNRELARGLEQTGSKVALLSSEGPGDFPANPAFLAQNPNLNEMNKRALAQDGAEAYSISRNMYPPRVADLRHPNAGLHCYAWEETEFPAEFAQGFNEHLSYICVTSEHVKKLLIDSGVDVPISVVGNGVDHWQEVTADPTYKLSAKSFKLLHVSSCFPRKGADVLVKAFAQSFTGDDDVSLIIKTFENPHNDIADQIEQLRQQSSNFPDIKLIFEDLEAGQLKSLYEQCDVLVAPSRAEGFGLPIAEAMLCGLDVITTGWSGQLEFCNDENVHLVDFSYAKASTHEFSFDSVWAEPDLDDLSQKLKQAFENAGAKTAQALQVSTLLDEFSWQNVAQRHKRAAHVSAPELPPSVGWVSTFRKRCGIATYSEHLLSEMTLPTVILADDGTVLEGHERERIEICWSEGSADDLSALKAQIEHYDFEVVLIQFNYGFFEFVHFNQLLLDLKRQGRTVIVTLHSTIDPAHDQSRKLAFIQQGLSVCDRLLVHSVNDLNRLKTLALDKNAALFPHGALVTDNTFAREIMPVGTQVLHLAAYGFFLPNKGLLELIEATKILRDRGVNARLKLVNAQFPAAISAELIKQAKDLVQKLELNKFVEFHTKFLADEDSLSQLSSSDMIIYPYKPSGESASGAVRYGIATGKPVLVSPSPIFDDVSAAVHYMSGTSPQNIVDGVLRVVKVCNDKDTRFTDKLEGAKKWRASHGYPTIARRLSGMVRALHRENT